MLIALIPIAISGIFKEPKRSHFLQPVFQLWLTFFFIFTGVRRKFVGKRFFNGDTYIIVCNHNSLLDPPLSSPGIPEANKTIAKIEMAKIPLFGIIYKSGSVLVNRKNDQSRKQSYADMKKVLGMGLHMCIYPEGTRNKTREPLQRFHDGAFKLAVDTNTPILPSLLFHTKKVMPSNKTFYFWPHPVEMHFLPPVSPEGKSIHELKNEVYEIMKTYYLQHNN
jgi:1-acyl-sn-glycerol-3-phosphate acyltransferase